MLFMVTLFFCSPGDGTQGPAHNHFGKTLPKNPEEPPGWATLSQVYLEGPGGPIYKSLRTVLSNVAVVLLMVSPEHKALTWRWRLSRVQMDVQASVGTNLQPSQFLPAGRLALPQHMRSGQFRLPAPRRALPPQNDPGKAELVSRALSFRPIPITD